MIPCVEEQLQFTVSKNVYLIYLTDDWVGKFYFPEYSPYIVEQVGIVGHVLHKNVHFAGTVVFH
jgi:hypothetical protein